MNPVPSASQYLAGGGFTGSVQKSSPAFSREDHGSAGGFGSSGPKQQRAHADNGIRIGKNGEIKVSDEELQRQIEMYNQFQTSSGIKNSKTSVQQQQQPQKSSGASGFEFDHGFGRFDTYSQAAAGGGGSVPKPSVAANQPQPEEFDFNFGSDSQVGSNKQAASNDFFDFGADIQ